MSAPDPALQKALDDLTTQVNPANILAAHNVFQNHAFELGSYLSSLTGQTRVERAAAIRYPEMLLGRSLKQSGNPS